MNICVGETKHPQTKGFQILGPDGILGQTCFLKMLGAIQFHDQLCFGAVKIHNIPAKGMLPPELYWVMPEILIP